MTAQYLPKYFNCSNDDLSIDDRSGKKGPEPETVTVGTVGDKTFAFVTLERIGGVMAYDITNPADVSFVNYINSRDFSSDVAGDNSREGLKFIPASESPTGKALLMAACEVGGTVAVYEMDRQSQNNNAGNDSNNGGGSSGDSNDSDDVDNNSNNNVNSGNNSDSDNQSFKVTVTTKDTNIIVSASTVSSETISSVMKVINSDDAISIVDEAKSAVSVSAKSSNGSNIVNFTEPVSVKVPVSSTALSSVSDTRKLTLALVTKAKVGEIIITNVGGNYDAATNTFTALIDKAGDYVLLEDSNVKKLELTVGNAVSTVNGTQVVQDVETIISNDRTLVPLRYICEALDAEVTWNNETKTVTMVSENKIINMTVNEKIEGYDVAPVIYKDRTMVPIRYISDQLGANVIWSPSSKQVNITK